MIRLKIGVTIFLLSVTSELMGQNAFVPYFTYDPRTENYTIFYGQDSTRTYSAVFIPSIKIVPLISARVVQNNNRFLYEYTIVNQLNSIQKIRRFDLQTYLSSDSLMLPTGWFTRPYDYQAFTQFVFKPKRATSIAMGESLEFSQSSVGIPKIIEGRFVGQNDTLDLSFEFEPTPAVQKIIDSLEKVPANSFVSRSSIGPANPPNPFVALSFLDSISAYTIQSYSLGWVKNQSTANKYLGNFSSAKAQMQSNNVSGARTTLQTVLTDAISDSTSTLSSEAYALIYFNTQYLLTQLPLPPTGLNVKLVNSTGTKLTGGSLQYYDGSWKTAVNNNDGTFAINTTLKSVSLQMTYAYGVQTKSNVTVGSDTVVFQTVNAQVKLQNSQGRLMDTGTVQYYAGAWRNLGTTSNGVATMELLPINYSFRMTYAFASNDKAQDLSANATVTFQTTNASVQLKNSQGSLMDTGAVQYYSGAWRTLGTTVNGAASMELLPNSYSFRMTYAYGSNDKAQNIGANSTVIFQTVNAAVQLKNSQGSLIDQGTVQYYSGAWRSFGTTSGGIAMKELLSNSYAFRMTYAFGSNDKTQDVGSNNTVVFSTVLATVNVINAQNNPVNNAVVTYYSGAWRSFDNTVNGNVSKELLPANLQFRAQSGYVLQNKTQDISTNPVVVITLNVGQ